MFTAKSNAGQTTAKKKGAGLMPALPPTLLSYGLALSYHGWRGLAFAYLRATRDAQESKHRGHC